TGPEHYREAERLLRDEYRTDRSVAEAQVHATLALAAATALSDPGAADGGMTPVDYMAWEKAAAVQPPSGGGAG
ncbi:MAG: hypothetical protein ACRDXB_07190, partial [Actinomycetes bacterium]